MTSQPEYSRVTRAAPSGDVDVFRVLTWHADVASDVALVIHHGIGEHAGRYQALVDGLRPRPTVAFDLRGHGHSSGRRGDADGLDGLADDFLGLFPELLAKVGATRAVVVGHSMGGAVVARILTHRAPPPSWAGVVLSAPALAVRRTPSMAVKERLGRAAKRLWPRLTLPTGLDASGISSDPAEVRRYADDPLNHDRISLRLADSLLRQGPDAVGRAERVELPLLVVHGEADPIIPLAGSRDFARGARGKLVTFPNGRHECHHEVPVVRFSLFQAVNRFVDAVVDAQVGHEAHDHDCRSHA